MGHYEQFPKNMGMIWRAGFNGYLFKEELHGDGSIKFTSLNSPRPHEIKCSREILCGQDLQTGHFQYASQCLALACHGSFGKSMGHISI
mmetsp:Transcript_1731/g.4008  ORF Transcript_1731/g.4008 Transcript_1731/m.4008 type:complete len:89 (+) Transcript_1731:243-509(+)